MITKPQLKTFLLVLLCCLPFGSTAQEYLISKKYLSVEDGLSNSQVSKIYQDREGFMWFLTAGGLDRYDGSRIKNYEIPRAVLEVGGFNNIKEDKAGDLWLFSQRPKVYYNAYHADLLALYFLENSTGRIISFQEKFPNSPFQYLEIREIHQDANNSLWIGLSNGDVWKYDNTFSKIYDGAKSKERPVLSISTSSENTIYLSMDHYIQKIDLQGNILAKDSVPNVIAKQWVDKEGTLWIKTIISAIDDPFPSHSFYIKKEGTSPTPFFRGANHPYKWLDSPRSDFLEDKQGRIWVNARHGNLVFDKAGDLIYDLSDKFGEKGKGRWINADYFSEEVIWFISQENNENGVFSLTLRDNPFKKYMDKGSPPFSMRGIMAINDSIFRVHSYLGNFRFNIKTRTKKRIGKRHYNQNGYGLTCDSSGNVYSGYHANKLIVNSVEGEELNVYDLPGERNDALLPFVDQRQQLWIGAKDRLAYVDPVTDEVQNFKAYQNFPAFKDQRVFHFYENQYGIWLCTYKGLFLLDQEKGIIDHFNHFPSNRLTFLHEDSLGIFWLGTADSGLLRWDRTRNEIKKYNTNSGLSNNTIHAILEDEYGGLWMSSNYGLIRFDKATEKIRNFFEEDGISHNEFNIASFYQHGDGTFYFGGLNGLTTLHPRDFKTKEGKKNLAPVATKFEKLDVNSGELLDQTMVLNNESKITLQPEDKSFIVHLGNLDFSHAAQQRYVYKIEDIDEQWIPFEENYIRINQLPYGNFLLKIKNLNKEGVWSKELIIPITVLQPVYTTTWFLALAAFAGLLLIWGFIRYRTYRLRKRAEQLHIEVFHRTRTIEAQRQELEQMNRIKDKFFSLIGHDLKTPLIALSGLTQKLNFLIEEKRYDDMDRLCTSINQSSSNMARLLDNLMEWALLQKKQIQVKPQLLDIEEIIGEVIDLYRDVTHAKKIKLQANDLSQYQVFADRNSVSTILRNLYDNAVKYTPVGQEIKIYSKQDGASVSIHVENFGRILKKESIQSILNGKPVLRQNGGSSGLGLLICKELTEINHGVFSISSNTRSTIASVTLPAS